MIYIKYIYYSISFLRFVKNHQSQEPTIQLLYLQKQKILEILNGFPNSTNPQTNGIISNKEKRKKIPSREDGFNLVDLAKDIEESIILSCTDHVNL